MLEQMQDRTLEAINRTTVGPFADRGNCYGGGPGYAV